MKRMMLAVMMLGLGVMVCGCDSSTENQKKVTIWPIFESVETRGMLPNGHEQLVKTGNALILCHWDEMYELDRYGGVVTSNTTSGMVPLWESNEQIYVDQSGQTRKHENGNFLFVIQWDNDRPLP